jgi:hypothetical protein
MPEPDRLFDELPLQMDAPVMDFHLLAASYTGERPYLAHGESRDASRVPGSGFLDEG